jgi:FixJ family two-component response regulator
MVREQFAQCLLSTPPVAGTVWVYDEDSAARDQACNALTMPCRTIRGFASTEQLLQSHVPDGPLCLILEMCFNVGNGLQLQERLAGKDSAPEIIFFTTCTDVEAVVRAMQAGAVDYLVKPASADTLTHAVQRALKRSAASRSVTTARERVRRLVTTLTQREFQVMEAVVAGRLNKQIAQALMISDATVKMHRGNLMRKMGVRNVAQLVTMIDLVPDLNPATVSPMLHT